MSSIAPKIINPSFLLQLAGWVWIHVKRVYQETGVIDGLWLMVGGVGVTAQLLLSSS